MFHCRLKIKVLILVSFILKVHVCMHILPKQRDRSIRAMNHRAVVGYITEGVKALIGRWEDEGVTTSLTEGDVVSEFITMSTRCSDVSQKHSCCRCSLRFILCGPWLAAPPGNLQVCYWHEDSYGLNYTVPPIGCLNMQMRRYLVKYVLICI